MRPIKFRGKHKASGEWVYGLPTSVSTITFAETEITHINQFFDDRKLGRQYVEMIPETLGEFTGLNDKNGKELFEGDICRFGSGMIRSIDFKNGGFGYLPDLDWRDDFVGFAGHNHFTEVLEKIEVIGNIYENPELIK